MSHFSTLSILPATVFALILRLLHLGVHDDQQRDTNDEDDDLLPFPSLQHVELLQKTGSQDANLRKCRAEFGEMQG